MPQFLLLGPWSVVSHCGSIPSVSTMSSGSNDSCVDVLSNVFRVFPPSPSSLIPAHSRAARPSPRDEYTLHRSDG